MREGDQLTGEHCVQKSTFANRHDLQDVLKIDCKCIFCEDSHFSFWRSPLWQGSSVRFSTSRSNTLDLSIKNVTAAFTAFSETKKRCPSERHKGTSKKQCEYLCRATLESNEFNNRNIKDNQLICKDIVYTQHCLTTDRYLSDFKSLKLCNRRDVKNILR